MGQLRAGMSAWLRESLTPMRAVLSQAVTAHSWASQKSVLAGAQAWAPLRVARQSFTRSRAHRPVHGGCVVEAQGISGGASCTVMHVCNVRACDVCVLAGVAAALRLHGERALKQAWESRCKPGPPAIRSYRCMMSLHTHVFDAPKLRGWPPCIKREHAACRIWHSSLTEAAFEAVRAALPLSFWTVDHPHTAVDKNGAGPSGRGCV